MKILFLHRWLVVGGAERILINYLKLLDNINKEQGGVTIDLLIAFEQEPTPFLEEIPDNVNLSYLFDKKKLDAIDCRNQNRNHRLLNRIYHKYHDLKDERFHQTYPTKLIAEKDYDVVINFGSHFDAYLEFNKIHVPIIRWRHGALTKRETKYLKKYTKVVSICHEMTEFIKTQKRRTKLDDKKLFTLFNPVDFSMVIDKSLEKIDIKTPYFIQVGRLDKAKRHKDLIDIYAELVKLGVKENLYIIGDGEEYPHLKDQIKALNLTNRCFLLGEIKNPYPYIKNATLFLHTSETEGLPTVLLESLVLNVPIVAMNCKTGVQEILNHGKCGKLITLGDKESFIKECFKLSQSEDLIKHYKEEMNKHLALFSEASIKQGLLTLLTEVIKSIPKKT